MVAKTKTAEKVDLISTIVDLWQNQRAYEAEKVDLISTIVDIAGEIVYVEAEKVDLISTIVDGSPIRCCTAC